MKFAILCAAVSLSFSLAAAEYSAADRALAIELLKADGTEQVLDQTFNSALTQMSPKDSDPARPVIERYLKKCFSFEVLKEDLATIYLDNYTVDELKPNFAELAAPLLRTLHDLRNLAPCLGLTVVHADCVGIVRALQLS